MRTIQHTRTIPGTCPDRLFARLTRFEDYPEVADEVRSVVVDDMADGTVASSWEVDFRGGVLHWSEVDTVDHDARRIAFEQLKGDMAAFAGNWHVRREGDGSVVVFDATFDLGIPSLADLLEPVAEAALVQNIDNIIVAMAEAARDDVPAVPAALDAA